VHQRRKACNPGDWIGRNVRLQKEGGVMPQIKVIADMANDAVMHMERVNLEDFGSEHFRLQLVERLA
jgi:hypothetical protein